MNQIRYSRPVIDKVEGECPWVTYIKELIYTKNRCMNTMVLGEPGSGKSWLTLRKCYELDPDFELDGNWYFKAGSFMRAIKDYYKQDDYKKGKIWVMDEAGVDLYNLNFMDEVNKGLNAFFQTARHRNYIFFGTVPYISFISKGVRKLMTSQITAQGFEDNKTIAFPRILQYNPELDKDFKKALLVRDEDGSIKKCGKLLVSKPPVKLIREYEKMKSEFTTDLFSGIAERIEHFEEKRREKYLGKKLSIMQEKCLQLLKEGNIMKDIADKLGLTQGVVSRHLEAVRKKGIDFTGIREGKQVVRYEVNDPRNKLAKGLE